MKHNRIKTLLILMTECLCHNFTRVTGYRKKTRIPVFCSRVFNYVLFWLLFKRDQLRREVYNNKRLWCKYFSDGLWREPSILVRAYFEKCVTPCQFGYPMFFSSADNDKLASHHNKRLTRLFFGVDVACARALFKVNDCQSLLCYAIVYSVGCTGILYC